MNSIAKKTITLLLGIQILFGNAVFVFAQTPTTGGTTNQATTQTTTQTAAQQAAAGQAAAATGGATTTGSASSGGALGKAATSAVTCSVGQLFSAMLSNTIAEAIEGLATEVATDVATEGTKTISAEATAIPTNEKSALVEYAKKVKQDTAVSTRANIGMQIEGIFAGASWNSVAYCIVNAMIEYIADATIEWANRGFNGNPAFIDNPELFFESLADQEAGAFIEGLAKNTLGVNVCEPFRVQVALNLRNQYSRRGQFQGQCSLDQVVNNIDSFIDGNFEEGGWRGWFEMTQYDQNNPRGLELIANQYMNSRIIQKQNSLQLQLGWNKGFLSYQKCSDPKDPKSCRVTTPGSLIESQLSKTLNIGKERLVLAEKFDQVVEAVVSNLIKVALSELLQPKEEREEKNKDDDKQREEDTEGTEDEG